jgi:aminopeptidase N
MGAMENKGLNIFNTSCVLADEEYTTDAAIMRVQSVMIAHEYFHNWTVTVLLVVTGSNCV